MMDFLSRSSASLLDKLSKKSSTQKAGLIYAVSIGSLVAYNIRWKYLLPSLLGIKARKLPFTKKVATGDIKYISIILLHGMWHDSSYYAELQDILAKEGYASYAIDLLPGERFSRGGSQQELVQDLEYTLEDIEGPYILLGHSQGGLVVQAALQKSDVIRKTAEGVVLLGTYPLGLTPPVSAILKEKRNMYMDLGYAFFCFFGKLMNTRYTKHIFLLPNTDEMSEEVSSYIAKLLKAPSDGRVTMSHFPATPKPLDTPALILGAQDDIIYPPHLYKEAFNARFNKPTHIVVPNQAHCFRDAGWQKTTIKPLVNWLEAQVPDVI